MRWTSAKRTRRHSFFGEVEMRTWGELRTLNKNGLVEEMAKLSKGKYLIFNLSVNGDEMAIVPRRILQDIDTYKNDIQRLQNKINTISSVLGL